MHRLCLKGRMGLTQTSDFTISSKANYLEDLHQTSDDLCLNYCGCECCNPGQRCDVSGKKIYELHIISEGKGIFEINKKKYELSVGDAFFVPVNTSAFYQADEENPWSHMWVGVSGYKAYECIENCGFSLKIPVHRVYNMEKLKKCIDDMLGTRSRSYADELRRNGCLMLFFAELMEDYKNNASSSMLQYSYPGSVYVQYAIDYISCHYTERIKINELADYIGVNRSYLASSFKKSVGCSPQEYLVNLRMEKAKSLLRKTNMSINAISNALGYTDQLAFSKIFKKHYGVSPKIYRSREEEKAVKQAKGGKE